MRSHQTEQGIAQTYSLMMSLRAEGVPRKLALITLAWTQLLAGTQQPVLSNVMNALPHLTPMKWIPSIRDFLHTIGGQIEVGNLPAIPLQHEHDRFLMDIALDLYSKPSDLQHLNTCWLHLQVTLLSDITTADGKFIRSKVTQSHRPLSNSAKELFSYQPSPDSAGWNIWRAFLEHPHTPLSNHSEDGSTPPTPCSVSGRHTSICLQVSSTFINKIFLMCMKHSHLPLITNTLPPQSPTPPPPPNSVPVDLDLSGCLIL